ncbi:hypothetical protein GCK72_007745 [Caenorhabditis remanei]|uniref:Uncharacterized protein n=1 Tax=Caenorhabditis remanei TaxID=31234 RepID=A0A6A5HM82_CAERE|nr:hypothetical protein GCK72_007745 [Caenorhabditis remanei]KAF1767786.1 hypothetical protein GCK72_007745 [Caenorhabditis remanei]
MFSDEIDRLLLADTRAKRTFIGVFGADELETLGRIRKRRFGLVVNTDRRDQPGRHWQSIFVDNDRQTCHYFCSLAEKPNAHIERYLSKFPVVKINKSKQQKNSALTCGGYCVFVQSMQARGIPFETICTVFDSITNDDVFIANYLKQNHGYVSSPPP